MSNPLPPPSVPPFYPGPPPYPPQQGGCGQDSGYGSDDSDCKFKPQKIYTEYFNLSYPVDCKAQQSTMVKVRNSTQSAYRGAVVFQLPPGWEFLWANIIPLGKLNCAGSNFVPNGSVRIAVDNDNCEPVGFGSKFYAFVPEGTRSLVVQLQYRDAKTDYLCCTMWVQQPACGGIVTSSCTIEPLDTPCIPKCKPVCSPVVCPPQPCKEEYYPKKQRCPTPCPPNQSQYYPPQQPCNVYPPQQPCNYPPFPPQPPCNTCPPPPLPPFPPQQGYVPPPTCTTCV